MIRQDWAPLTTAGARRMRARLYREIRHFFEAREVLEVETPMLSQAGNTDPQIDSVCVDPSASGDALWLRTSAEFPMKRLVADDPVAIYELGRVFRAGESGRLHNPEFTMLEWYRPGWGLPQLIDEVLALLQGCFGLQQHSPASRKHDYVQLFRAVTSVCPLDSDDQTLAAAAAPHALVGDGLDRASCIDLLMALQVQPSLEEGVLHVISRYPADQAALARIDPDDHRRSLRFEVFYGPVELANGYDELCDADELSARFRHENALRETMDKPPMPVDERLIAALEHGLPACSGVAMGIDRLLMCLLDVRTIGDVINFTEDCA